MRYYTDLQDFAKGCAKLAKMYKDVKHMPIILEVDGVQAPFGIHLNTFVNGVDSIVFCGTTSSMKNVTPETRKKQIKDLD